MREQTKIYVLIDPRTMRVRYIGITCQSLTDRLGNHIHDAKYRPEENWHKARWILQLLDEGYKPIIRQICHCDTRKNAEEIESKLIVKYKEKHNLVNIDTGNGSFTSRGQHSAAVCNSKKLYVYNYDGTYYGQFNSIIEGSEELGIYHGTITKCLTGIYKYAKGFQFSYTKVESMPSLVEYSTGSSKEVTLLDNETGELIRYKSGVACKEALNLELKTTSHKYILGALNKYYGNRYSMLVDEEFVQSTYYNTGVIIKTTFKEYQFKSKKDLLAYMGYKIKSIDDEHLFKYIYKHFDKVEDITFNWPLCLVTSKENPS